MKLLQLTTSLTKVFKQTTRTHMISFPQRPSMSERYSGIEAIKSASIPAHTSPVMPTLPPAFQFENDIHKDEIINKPDGSVLFITDKLPEKYKKPVLSDEEIEYIMRGGPDW